MSSKLLVKITPTTSQDVSKCVSEILDCFNNPEMLSDNVFLADEFEHTNKSEPFIDAKTRIEVLSTTIDFNCEVEFFSLESLGRVPAS